MAVNKKSDFDRLLAMGVAFLLTDRDIAYMLGYKPGTIKQKRYRDPSSLPPSYLLGKFHRYVPDEVRQWLIDKLGMTPEQARRLVPVQQHRHGGDR